MSTVKLDARLPPREQWPDLNEHCPMARTLEFVSTRSAFLVLREAFYGATRFEQFVDRTGVSEPVAAARLREFVAEGLMEKVPYREPGQRQRSGYGLTDKGSDLLPVLVAMMNWGDRWVFDGGGRVRLRHRDCGERVEAVLQCEAGHDVGRDELELVGRPRRPRSSPDA